MRDMEKLTGQPTADAEVPSALGFRPLYLQVKERLTRRLADGSLPPGVQLPTELELAAEYGVSQGTVRKALDELAAQNLVVRRQGKGTFVASHSPDRSLFQFFPLIGNNGIRRLPSSRLLSCRYRRARSAETRRLALAADATVIHIRRVRSLNTKPALAEEIVVPAVLFPDLGLPPGSDLPNTLYDLYERIYGISIASVVERVSAVAASASEASLLSLAPGAALLQIDRIAYTVDGKPVEWRVSRCDTSQCHYQSLPANGLAGGPNTLHPVKADRGLGSESPSM